jgi:hypothetical protein
MTIVSFPLFQAADKVEISSLHPVRRHIVSDEIWNQIVRIIGHLSHIWQVSLENPPVV